MEFLKRGIATGANNFFTLSKSEVREFGLPKSALKSCITKASHIKGHCFDDEDLIKLKADDKKIYLIDAKSDQTLNVLKYLQRGEEINIHKRYLTSRRNPWYSIEKRQRSQIWVSVFSRGNPKIVWNETDALTLTCFHVFYSNEASEQFLPLIHLYLNTAFGRSRIESQKRQYGKGLDKLEPGDLNQVEILDFEKLEPSKVKRLQDIHSNYLESRDHNEIDSLLLEANDCMDAR